MTLSENTAARDAFTAFLTGLQPATHAEVAMTGQQTREHLFGWVYKQPGMATADDCRNILDRIAAERGHADALTVLQRHGCAHFKELFIGMYAHFYEYCKTVLYYGASPSAGWHDQADVLDGKRDRWLLWHDNSDCLWEVRGELSGEFDDGSVADVSGVEIWEKRFYDQLVQPLEATEEL